MLEHVATPARAGLMGAGDKAKLEKLNTFLTRNPLVTDDSSAGFFVGARWYNTSSGAEFVCSDPTLGAAVWRPAGGGGGGGSGDANVALILGLTGGSY